MNPFKKTHKQVSIFTTAGYPHIESLPSQLDLFERKGIDFVEVGVPFSDPLADGPTIQESSSVAIQNGINIDLIFEQLSQRTSNLPIVMMGYLNPIMKYGVERFLQKCQEIKIASLIIPDISIEIYKKDYQVLFEKYQISISLLVTPATDDERIIESSKLCSTSFVYLVSSNSITGSTQNIDTNRSKRYEEIKHLCGETPVFIGFGIRNKTDVQDVSTYCDGVIIGSAFISSIKENVEDQFLTELLA